MALSIFAQQKDESYEKKVLEDFTKSLHSLVSLASCLNQPDSATHEKVLGYIKQTSEGTAAAAMESAHWRRAVDSQAEQQIVSVEKLKLQKKNTERFLESLQIKLRHARENIDLGKIMLQTQEKQLAEQREHLNEKNQEVEADQKKIDELLPFLPLSLIIVGALLAHYKIALEEAKKVVREIEKAVSDGENAVSETRKMLERCCQEVTSTENEIQSKKKIIEDLKRETEAALEKKKELQEFQNQLKKCELFLKLLDGKVHSAEVIAQVTFALHDLVRALKEINALIQSSVDEGCESKLEFLFTPEVKALAADLQALVRQLNELVCPKPRQLAITAEGLELLRSRRHM